MKFIRVLALLAGLATSAVHAQTCPTFTAGDTNYIAKLNQLSAGCAPTGGGTPGSPLTTKGDLWTYTTTNARLAVGTNNYILTANSGTSTGLEWKNAINGVSIGATTTSSGAFTTLTASSTAAFSSTVSLGASSYLYFEQRAAPGSPPPSGAMAAWADATSNTLKTEDGDGNVSTTVIPNTGAANNFLTAISADGVVSRAQPSVSNISGFGTGVATALGTNVGSSGAFVTNGGALGTPSSGTGTNLTGIPISTGISGLGTGNATALAVNVGSTGSFNPMTTAGDIVIGGASGSPTRLAAGSTSGHVLTSNGSGAAPSWQAATGTVSYYGVRAARTVAYNIPDSTETAVSFDSESWDTCSCHDTASNQTRIVLNRVGKWRVTGRVAYNGASASGARGARIKFNGTTNLAIVSHEPVSNSTSTYVEVNDVVDATATTDYVEILAFQSSGIVLAGTVGTTATMVAAEYIGQ